MSSKGVQTISFRPYQDQKPGTSGLRKKLKTFQQPHYLESYIHSILLELGAISPVESLLLGGDGRTFMIDAIQSIIRLAAGHKVKKLYVAREGLLSTPAGSHLIRELAVDAGIILSASHNPGGLEGDFGVKLNLSHGGPAPFSLCEKVYQRSKNLTNYPAYQGPPISLSGNGVQMFGETEVHIVDSVESYADLMEGCFDFDVLRSALRAGDASFYFDAMHAASGPYAEEIFVKRLGLPEKNILNKQPLPDFGGYAPDPLPHKLTHLNSFLFSDNLSLAAASDGDGDRHLVMHNQGLAHPADLLALFAEHARSIPQYSNGLSGVARTMPTSRALDVVAEAHGVPISEVATGWKFFVNLLEAGKIGLCGEESFGIGGNHHREKDGLWSILFALSLMCSKKCSLQALLFDMWHKYGRYYFARCDYLGISFDQVDSIWALVKGKLTGENVETPLGTIKTAQQWDYFDESEQTLVANQGFQVVFENTYRVILRFSGTDTGTATLRAYFERYEPVNGDFNIDVADAISPLRTWLEGVLALDASIQKQLI